MKKQFIIFAGIFLFASTQPVLSDGGPLAKIDQHEAFTFAVCGDTRTGISVFKQQRDEINLLAPDFVINHGDFIEGHDDVRAEKMWDEFDGIVKEFTVPFVMVVGNHDIWSHSSRAIYERRYGKTYYSFNHKGAHFIALDSEVLDEAGSYINRIDKNQLDWLKQDLAANQNAAPIFVFVHKPLWQDIHVEEGASAHWMRDIHPLLAKHGVSAVFAGHMHTYIKFPAIDGVDYYVTGGGGAPLAAYGTQGNFYHYCFVTVRNKDYNVAVIKPGSVNSDTIVSAPMSMLLRKAISAIEFVDKKCSSTIEMEIHHSFGKRVDILIKPLENMDAHYKIKPQSQKIFVEEGAPGKAIFDIYLDDIQNVYPSPRFEVQMETDGKVVSTDVIIPIVKPVRTASCSRISKPVKIDGVLDDMAWANIGPLSDFWLPKGSRKADFKTQVRIAYDGNNIYFAFRCYEPNLPGMKLKAKEPDGLAWDDDSIEMFFDTNLDRRTYYQFVFNANGIVFDGYGSDNSWDGKHQARVSRESDAWTIEVAIPWETIQISRPKAGLAMGFSVVRTRSQSKTRISQWSPTYGGNQMPEQFGTLTLK